MDNYEVAMMCDPAKISRMVKAELLSSGGKSVSICLGKNSSYENCMGTITRTHEGVCTKALLFCEIETFRNTLANLIREHISDQSITIEITSSSYDERATGYEDYSTACYVKASMNLDAATDDNQEFTQKTALKNLQKSLDDDARRNIRQHRGG